MQFNSLIFPAPESCYKYRKVEKILWIPRSYSPKLQNVDDNKNDNKTNSTQEEIKEEFTSKDKKKQETEAYIPCLYLPYPQGSDKVLIFFHGNAEDIGWAMGFLLNLQEKLEVNILAMEYPGYSLYIGSPDANTILEDAVTVYEYITNEAGVHEDNIILFGRSIGSGPATHLAAKYRPSALILMSPYTSIKEVVKSMAGSLAKSLVAERFRNIDEIKKVKTPVLFIHGMADTLIPKEHSLELLNACLDIVSHIHLSETMTHNDFDLQKDILAPVQSFMKNCEIKVTKEGFFYKFPDEIRKKPESLNGKENKRSWISKLYDKFA